MDKIERVINFLKKVWYERNSPLKKYINYKGKDPFQILISTILSLRTKDELTYPIANNLFKKISDVKDFAEISIEELEKLIYPVGFYKTKAKNIKNISKIIIEKYNGQVPNSLEELLKLPGVGRKTANLVLSVGFGKDAICVDTHVHRISNRLGLVSTKSPEETEFKLMEILPRKYWREINYLMVGFGQTICKPLKPLCKECELKEICKYYNSKS
ncbi:MAG: endonuclease III domain-containing protein [Brevinematia bacterium]